MVAAAPVCNVRLVWHTVSQVLVQEASCAGFRAPASLKQPIMHACEVVAAAQATDGILDVWGTAHPHIKRIGRPTARQLCAERPPVQHTPSACLIAIPAPRGALPDYSRSNSQRKAKKTALCAS